MSPSGNLSNMKSKKVMTQSPRVHFLKSSDTDRHLRMTITRYLNDFSYHKSIMDLLSLETIYLCTNAYNHLVVYAIGYRKEKSLYFLLSFISRRSERPRVCSDFSKLF